jgi:methylase of polypeptide subunit release factors
MGTSFDDDTALRASIQKLVDRFDALGQAGHRYTESRTVNEFIIPLFAALGWDVRNERSPDEVVPEERVSRGRVDWAFRLRSVPMFYLEAKRPAVSLDDPDPAHQAINYAYNKGVTWAILTNFEALRVYNAEWDAPNPNLNLFFEIKRADYVTDPRMLWLRRQAFADGVLDTEADRVNKSLRKTPVGERLFADLLTYRAMLRYYLTGYNTEISAADIDGAVQRLLDRLIFIRTAEDRGIESYHLLPLVRELRDTKRIQQLWGNVLRLFREFDNTYDSQLFMPQRLDELDTEPQPIRVTIEGLYGNSSGTVQYDFGAIDADVLGGVYEQYLGQLAKAPADAKAKMSIDQALRQTQPDTRLFRKARGVYYTPKWVVQLIVDATVGRVLREWAPDDVRQMRVLDPACGSGSFLIEVFRCLAEYWHQKEPPSDEEAELAQRVRILHDNIYGVDLDPQAVEIAQLNLLLVALTNRTLLPDLRRNIIRGNSLVDSGRDDAFDFAAAFPFATEPGAFDVVIGNPPYVRSQTLSERDRETYASRYQTAKGSFDTYQLFLERALELSKPHGRIGFIVPGKFLSSSSGEATLLDHLYANSNIEVFVDAMRFRVFESALTYPVILVAQHGCDPAGYSLGRLESLGPGGPTISWEQRPTPLAATLTEEKLSEGWTTVAALGRVRQGLVTGADNVFALHGAFREPLSPLKSESLDRVIEIEAELLRPLVSGSRQVSRFAVATPEDWLLFPYRDGKLIPADEMKMKYPKALAYLELNRTRLEGRDSGHMKGPGWYGYSRTQNLTSIWHPKVLVPYMTNVARAAADDHGVLAIVNVTTGGYFVAPHDPGHLHYLTAALNSAHAEKWWREHATPHAGGYFGLTSRAIGLLPIPDPANLGAERLLHASVPTSAADDPFGRTLADLLKMSDVPEATG